MKILKAAKYTLATLVGIPVLLLLAIVIINAFDEELSPEVVALVRRAQSEQIAQQGNAYYAVRGLHAPSGQDIEVADGHLTPRTSVASRH